MKNVMKNKVYFSNRELFFLFFPLVLEQLLSYLVGFADSLMAAYIGESAVSGISLADQIMVLLISVFAAFSIGGSVIVGQYLGGKQKEKASGAASQLLVLNFLSSIAIMAVLETVRYALLEILFGDAANDVMQNSRCYFTYVLLSLPFLALYNGCAAIFRIMGNAKLPMLVSLLMNGINIVGNAIFIFGFHSGVEGIAIPTLISRVFAMMVVFRYLRKEKQVLSIEIKGRKFLKIDGKTIKKILSIGIPSGIEDSMFQFGKLTVLSLVSAFGTYAVTANAVSNTITMFQLLPGLAINLGVPTVIARCMGAGEHEQARYYIKKIIKITYLLMFLSIGAIQLLLPVILHIYRLSAITFETAYKILTFHGIAAILIWPISFTLPAGLRAAGDVRYSMTVSMFSMWVFRIAFSYLVCMFFEVGVFGVWVAKILDWCFRTVCFTIRYYSGKWKKKVI